MNINTFIGLACFNYIITIRTILSSRVYSYNIYFISSIINKMALFIICVNLT